MTAAPETLSLRPEVVFADCVGGYRGRTAGGGGHSWSHLMSMFQKMSRRGLWDLHGAALSSQIVAVLYSDSVKKYKPHFTNLQNRARVIVAEDIFDPIEIDFVIRDIAWNQDMRTVARAVRFLLYLLGRTGPVKSRRVSSYKALMFDYNESELGRGFVEAFPEYKISVEDNSTRPTRRKLSYYLLKNRPLFPLLRFGRVICSPACKTKGQVLNSPSRVKMVKALGILRQCVPDRLRTHFETLQDWFERVHHREEILFFVKAVLMATTAGARTTISSGELRMQRENEAKNLLRTQFGNMQRAEHMQAALRSFDPKFRLPTWARDQHTGRFKKGTMTGTMNFIMEGIEVDTRHPDDGPLLKYYRDHKIRAIRNKVKAAALPSFMRAGPLKSKVMALGEAKLVAPQRCKLPCGAKGGTFIATLDYGDGRRESVFVKELRSVGAPKFQMDIDALKPHFGLESMDLEYHSIGLLVGRDLGQGGPYKMSPHKSKPFFSTIDDSRAAQVLPARFVMSSKGAEAVARIQLFRGMFGVSDSHAGNLVLCADAKGKERVVSIDEMETRSVWPKFDAGLAELLFNNGFKSKLRTAISDRVVEWAKNNIPMVRGWLRSWAAVDLHTDNNRFKLMATIRAEKLPKIRCFIERLAAGPLTAEAGSESDDDVPLRRPLKQRRLNVVE